MAGDEITKIEVQDKEVREFLSRLNGMLQDTEPMMASISDILGSITESQFASESGPDGEPWKELAPSTIKQREKSGKWPGKMLQMSDAGLASSIQMEHGSDYAMIGPAKIYGRIHFLGGQAGRGQSVSIPARPYMPVAKDGSLSETAKGDILDIMQNYFKSANP